MLLFSGHGEFESGLLLQPEGRYHCFQAIIGRAFLMLTLYHLELLKVFLVLSTEFCSLEENAMFV